MSRRVLVDEAAVNSETPRVVSSSTLAAAEGDGDATRRSEPGSSTRSSVLRRRKPTVVELEQDDPRAFDDAPDVQPVSGRFGVVPTTTRIGTPTALRSSTGGDFVRETTMFMDDHDNNDDPNGPPIDPALAAIGKRVRVVMHIKKFFLAYHIAYIVLVSLICAIVLTAQEHNNAHRNARTNFLDAMFISVSGVTCTGLVTVATTHYHTSSIVVWTIAVFLGSTVFTSIAPSLLRIETLKLLRRLERDTMTELRLKHISRLLKTSRIMVVVTLTYAFFFFLLGMLMMGSSMGFFEGYIRTVSAFGNAGFLTNPPPAFYHEAINIIAVGLVVAAGSTLFPVFLRPYTWFCGLVFKGYIIMMTRIRPRHRIIGDPRQWSEMIAEVAVDVARRRVGDHSHSQSQTSIPSNANLVQQQKQQQKQPAATNGNGNGNGNGHGETTEQQKKREAQPLLRDRNSSTGAGELTIGGPGRQFSYGTPHADDDDDDGDSPPQRARTGSDFFFTGLQNTSMVMDNEVVAEATGCRVRENTVVLGFKNILASRKPVNHHPWLFVRSDTTYLFIAWCLIVLFQFIPYTFQQWNSGALGEWHREYMKALVGVAQSICNRFSGIQFFDLNQLGPGQICTILFALYLPALPIPTGRTHRKWKEMFSGGFFRLLGSRFWWLFTATFVIIFIEEDHAYANIAFTDSAVNVTAPPGANDPSPPPHVWAHGALTRTLFEVLSAYATSGITLQLPTSIGSLSSSFTAVSKIIIMLVMLAGRHRNMDLGLDIGLTDMAATERRDPDRARRIVNDFDVERVRDPLSSQGGRLGLGSPLSPRSVTRVRSTAPETPGGRPMVPTHLAVPPRVRVDFPFGSVGRAEAAAISAANNNNSRQQNQQQQQQPAPRGRTESNKPS